MGALRRGRGPHRRRLAGGALSGDALDALLAEQRAYYDAGAGEYGRMALPPQEGGNDIAAALEAFGPRGDVLELACGPGTWTPALLRHADRVTAVDASPRMLETAARRVGRTERVRFLRADLFGWRPERRYDVVFFGFWLSHVPLERFEAFWSLVDDSLADDGRVFFVDDAYRTPDELIEGEDSSTIRRRLEDGRRYRAVKVPHDPASLQSRLEGLGWDIRVHRTPGVFFWGEGGRATAAGGGSGVQRL